MFLYLIQILRLSSLVCYKLLFPVLQAEIAISTQIHYDNRTRKVNTSLLVNFDAAWYIIMSRYQGLIAEIYKAS